MSIPLPLCEATDEPHGRNCCWNDQDGSFWEVRVVGAVAVTFCRWKPWPNMPGDDEWQDL